VAAASRETAPESAEKALVYQCNLCKKIPELCALRTKSNADFLHFDGEAHAKKP